MGCRNSAARPLGIDSTVAVKCAYNHAVDTKPTDICHSVQHITFLSHVIDKVTGARPHKYIYREGAPGLACHSYRPAYIVTVGSKTASIEFAAQLDTVGPTGDCLGDSIKTVGTDLKTEAGMRRRTFFSEIFHCKIIFFPTNLQKIHVGERNFS